MAGIAIEGKPADRLDAITQEAVPEAGSTACSAARFRQISAPPAAMVSRIVVFSAGSAALDRLGRVGHIRSGIGA
jgi:hypothetical protein